MNSKICTKCNESKELVDFVYYRRYGYNRNSYGNICKKCNNLHTTRRYTKRYHTDLEYQIKRRLRTRLRKAVLAVGTSKRASSKDLLGCSLDEFRVYLEGKFTKGMTWDLLKQGLIHIDHIIPCAAFDLTKEEEQRKCFHYTNLQPLWALDNLIKGDSLNHPSQKAEVAALGLINPKAESTPPAQQ